MVCLAGQLFKFSLHARATPLSLLFVPVRIAYTPRIPNTHIHTFSLCIALRIRHLFRVLRIRRVLHPI